MKEMKLKKTSRVLSIILNVGCIIMGIFTVLLALGIFITLCTPIFAPKMFQDAWESALQAGQQLTVFQCIFFFLCTLGVFVCIFLALYNAKKIFSCIGKGNTPFTNSTASQIRRIAVCVIGYAIFSIISIFKIDFALFFICALFSLILLCISFIFDYGCELQKEVDETL